MKTIIYQVFTRVFGNGKFLDFDTKSLRRIKQLGATHIWYTGVIRHASCADYSAYGIPTQTPDVVKGKAGSPYAICDYYDVDPDLATNVEERMSEWEQLIQRTHDEGLKVIMDFVPNHVAREYKSINKGARGESLNEENFYVVGESLTIGNYTERPALATGNNVFNCWPSNTDWYETVKLNYDNQDTWRKMSDIMLFWASKGVDAFRCDMAELVPTAFWFYASARLKEQYPNILLIGEVYNPSLYRDFVRAGFDYLYDKVGLYDTLRDIVCYGCPTTGITHRWQEVDDIRDKMLYFLENHDEQRIASDFFAKDPWKAIPALMVSAWLYTNPLMIYAGEEFGERGMDQEGFSGLDGRTTIFDYWKVESIYNGFYNRRKMTAEQKALEKAHKEVLYVAKQLEGGSYDLMYVNPHLHQQYAWIRGNDTLLVVNFAGEEVSTQVTVPAHAFEFLGIENQGDKTYNVSIPAYSGAILPLL